MDKITEKAFFMSMILNGIASIFAIISFFMGINNIISMIIIIFLMLLLNILYYVCKKYNKLKKKYDERTEFIAYINFLFNNEKNKFNLLPKIDLVIDKSEEINVLYINQLSAKYIYDMSKIDTTKISQKEKLEYDSVIEYEINAKNEDLPVKYIYYRGNMSAKEDPKAEQKYGTMASFRGIKQSLVYHLDLVDDVKVERYEWLLENKNIRKDSDIPFPLSFRFKYKDFKLPNSEGHIVLNPNHFAVHVEKINVEIEFISTKQILKRAELNKVWKHNDRFEYMHIDFKDAPETNTIIFDIPRDIINDKVYHIRIFWELV
jgi:hypothetical protein